MATPYQINAYLESGIVNVNDYVDFSLAVSALFTDGSNSSSANLIPKGTPLISVASGSFTPGIAANLQSADIVALAADSFAAGGTGRGQSHGSIEQDTTDWDLITGGNGGLVPADRYYLSAAVVGRMTNVPPSADGTVLIQLGYAHSSTVFIIDIERPVVL